MHHFQDKISSLVFLTSALRALVSISLLIILFYEETTVSLFVINLKAIAVFNIVKDRNLKAIAVFNIVKDRRCPSAEHDEVGSIQSR
jgi:hypothetical protein